MRCGTLKECQSPPFPAIPSLTVNLDDVLARHDEDDRVLLDDDRILEIDLVEIDPDLALEDVRIDEAALGTVQMIIKSKKLRSIASVPP